MELENQPAHPGNEIGAAPPITAMNRWRRAARRCYAAAAVLAIVAILYAGVFAVHDAREAARRSQCRNNLKQIGLALHTYHQTHGCFTPAYVADSNGRPMHSWRVLIAPYLDASPFYNMYRRDEPWDGPHNRQLRERYGKNPVFGCPSDRNSKGSDGSQMTSYLAIIGPESAWHVGQPVSLDDVSDSTGDTFLLVEVENSSIHWMEPRDLHVTQMPLTVNAKSGNGISSSHPGGANVLTVDGSVQWLPDGTPPMTIKAMITIRGGEKVTWPP
ncbi:MAG: DUF1559 domain-containing protein [Planctomycetia bacterium]|nr:DUF1559 domain-containing protein [Planctomycetia bacterium]